jgi:hypothetical protein
MVSTVRPRTDASARRWGGSPESAPEQSGAHPVEPALPSGLLVFVLALGGYLVLGAYTVLRWNLVMGDALSRLAGANYAIASRDPHLTAIGFVWNPLPTLAMIPSLALRPLWDALGEPGYAATIASATAMAFAVAALHRLAARWGLGRVARGVVVLAFAANPLVALYATNGMSEAFVLAFLIPAVGGLASWIDDTRDTAALVRCSVLVGLGYLVRYEVLAAAAGVALVVAVVTWQRVASEERRAAIVGNVMVVLAPSFIGFLVFALSSWLITGSLAEQFTSAYGNTAVIASDSTLTLSNGIRFSITAVAVLAPLLPLLLAAVLLRNDMRAVRRMFAAFAVLGAVVAFAAASQAAGSTLHFLRFFVAAIPLQLLVAMALVAPREPPDPGTVRWSADAPARERRRARSAVAVLAVVGLFGAATTFAGMLDPDIGVQEHQLATLLDPRRDSAEERAVLRTFETEQRVAAFLDRLDLPPGSVLVDVLFGFPIVLASDNPEQFVIPSDRDWAQVLADPVGHGVQYLLTVPDEGRGEVDSLNRRFPGIYAGDADVGPLRLDAVNDGGGPDWRLYELAPRG